MAVSGNLSPIKQALVQALRANAALKAVVTGDIHEGFAPPKTKFPHIVYSIAYAPIDYLWGSMMMELGVDVVVFAENSVDADNIDALVFTTLHDAELRVTEQSTLICRRVSSISLPESNEEGKKIYQVGGTYEIWTDQPLPTRTTQTLSADAVLT